MSLDQLRTTADVLAAVIHDTKGEPPVQACYALIAALSEMVERLPPTERLFCALLMHQRAIDFLPQADDGPVVTYMNGESVSID
jgi:hypothetical protein